MKIKFKTAVWCAAAGRPYNEDNFQVKENLSHPDWGIIHTDKLISLSDKGALMVVCDGMGGTNAGEVASKLAVEAIEECFAPEHLTSQVLATPETIMHFIQQSIIAADAKIKEDAKRNKEHNGMGSTIVLAWMVGSNVYVGWCGDSRAYRFNPVFGLEQLSHDHSYVQELVDEGKLRQEYAFDHPDSNIITRSLGDSGQKARPEVKCFPLYNGDIIMLCSDGLSGVLRDREMEVIMSQNTDSMEKCRTALWSESEKVGWTDNVTIALCQIVSGAEMAPKKGIQYYKESDKPPKRRKNIFLFALTAIVLTGTAFEIGVKVGSEKPPFNRKERVKSENLKTETDTLPKPAAIPNPDPMSSNGNKNHMPQSSPEKHEEKIEEKESPPLVPPEDKERSSITPIRDCTQRDSTQHN